jgi:hypothetical protein
MTEHYRFEEFDRDTRDYLLLARDQQGRGVPGIYLGMSDWLPAVGLVLGFVVLIVTVTITVPPTDPPIKEALLQTAGLLFGGWLILAALRVWSASRSDRYAGRFDYADPDYLYRARGSAVTVIDLGDLREAKAVQNFSDGRYQSTSINLKLGRERKSVTVYGEERGRRLAMYLTAVAYMRDGGESGKDEALRTLPPEAMGAVARKVALTGEFPADPARADEGFGVRVPRPRREGRPSTGLFGLVLIGLIGTALFLGLVTVNHPFRDEAVFARIKALPPNEQPPLLRLYLDHDKFTAHREEAKQLLDLRYEDGIRANINGSDADMKRGLAEVVLALKDKPTAALSLRAVEEVPPKLLEASRSARQKAAGEKLADKWGVTIGDELVVFAMLEDPDLPANIELRWKFTDAGEIGYTITFRKSPDEEPLATGAGIVPAGTDANRTLDAMCNQILAQSVGPTKIRPTVPPEDF